MFSLLLVFLYLACVPSSGAARTSRPCLTFTRILQSVNSTCQITSTHASYPSCLICNITENNTITTHGCRNNLTCITLNFPYNSIFEHVMSSHYRIIHSLFRNVSWQRNNTFTVNINSFNRTKIDLNYYMITFGMSFKPYHSLYMVISKFVANSTALRVGPDLNSTRLDRFYLRVPCRGNNGTIYYNITTRPIKLTEDPACTSPTTTQQTTSALLKTSDATSSVRTSGIITTVAQALTTAVQTTLTTKPYVTTKLFMQTSPREIIMTDNPLPEPTSKATTNEIETTAQTESTLDFTSSLVTTSLELIKSARSTSTSTPTVISEELTKSSSTISQAPPVSTTPSQRSTKRPLLFLLGGLLLATAFGSLIITYVLSRYRTKTNYPSRESLSKLSNVSSAQSADGSSHLSPTFLSSSMVQRGKPRSDSDLTRTTTRTFDKDF